MRRADHTIVIEVPPRARNRIDYKKTSIMQDRTTMRESNHQLHRAVLNEIEGLLKQVGRTSGNERVSRALENVEKLVTPIRDALVERIGSLEDHARWDKFTIAFYGETNAGKSTTIETLRMLLGEKTKVEARRKFNALQQAYGLTDSMMASLQASIEAGMLQLQALSNEEADASARQQVNGERKALQKLIDERDDALAKLAELSSVADGFIVGTGRSDFTRHTQAYTFDVSGKTFEILDVPGIEGKEADVIDSILGAVQSAHAVFYITGKAAPPQTGDANGNGTLEKIREHLGDHSEVWSIYNKRITNPIMLEKPALLNGTEPSGVAALDATMREHLDSKYRGCIPLSAQPAFLAAADCLAPGSDLLRNRAKFLSKFGVEEVVAKSGFRSFVDRLTGPMMTDCEARMHAANVHKVRCAVDDAQKALSVEQRNTIGPLAAQCHEDWKLVDRQLALHVDALGKSMLTIGMDAVASFETRARDSIYKQISRGIDNDDLKSLVKRTIQDEQALLEAEVKKRVEDKFSGFQKDVSTLLERFRERVMQLQDAYGAMNNRGFKRDFDLKMDIDSGVQYTALIGALIGGLLLAWNPIGWVSLAIGGLTILVTVVKAVWSFFDSDYKKAQQRKAANENLARVVKSMREGMEKHFDELRKAVVERMDGIRSDMARSVNLAAEVNAALIQVCGNLNRLSNSMAGTASGNQTTTRNKVAA